MDSVNLAAIVVAAVAADLIGTLWYVVVGGQHMDSAPAESGVVDDGRPPAWKLLVELGRSLVVASVIAGLVVQLGVVDWTAALGLGIAIWIGFPVTLLVGSVIWEGVAPRLAVIHAGHWLVKTSAIALIVALWR